MNAAWIPLGLLAMQACHSGTAAPLDPIVARVGSKPVVRSEVVGAYAFRRQALPAPECTQATRAALWAAALDDVIAWHVVGQAAHEQHVAVLEDEVDGALAQLAAASQAMAAPPGAWDGDGEQAVDCGQANGVPQGDLEATPSTGAAAKAPPDLPRNAAWAAPAGDVEPAVHSPELASQPLRLRDAVRQRLLVAKYFAQEVAARIAVTAADIEAFAAAHPELLVRPARHRLRLIVLPGAQSLSPLKKALQQGKPLDRALQPEPSAEVIDVGWVRSDELPGALRARVASLPVQTLSAPWPHGEGVMAAWVSERQSATTEPLSAAWRRVERRLRSEKERAAEAEQLQRLTQAARVEVIDAALPIQLP